MATTRETNTNVSRQPMKLRSTSIEGSESAGPGQQKRQRGALAHAAAEQPLEDRRRGVASHSPSSPPLGGFHEVVKVEPSFRHVTKL